MSRTAVPAVAAALPRTRTGRAMAAVLLAEALVLGGYLAFTSAVPTHVRYLAYPFVWMNLGLWGVLRVYPAVGVGSRRVRVAAAAVAVAYFLVLAWLAGLVALYLGPGAHDHAYLRGWLVTVTAPGWGPRIAYVGEAFHVYFVPYRVVGYGALAYLVYAALLGAARSAVGGVLGVAACVGCTFPAVAPAIAAVTGGGAGLTAAATGLSMDLSTAAFALTVLALTWRPGG